MPDFYQKMKNKLRTVEQGADTIVWLAISQRAREEESGLFYQDRKPVAEHLPLAWSRAKAEDEDRLMAVLADYEKKFKEPH